MEKPPDDVATRTGSPPRWTWKSHWERQLRRIKHDAESTRRFEVQRRSIQEANTPSTKQAKRHSC